RWGILAAFKRRGHVTRTRGLRRSGCLRRRSTLAAIRRRGRSCASRRFGSESSELREEVAVRPGGAAIAEGAWLADSAAVENQCVGCPRPFRGWHRGAKLLFDDFGIVRARDTQAVGDAENVAVDGQARDAQRVAEDNVGRLAADTRQLDELLHRA